MTEEFNQLVDALLEDLRERSDHISWLQYEFQKQAEGLDVITVIGAAMQLMIHGVNTLAEEAVDRIPEMADRDPLELRIDYLKAFMGIALSTTARNERVEVGRDN